MSDSDSGDSYSDIVQAHNNQVKVFHVILALIMAGTAVKFLPDQKAKKADALLQLAASGTIDYTAIDLRKGNGQPTGKLRVEVFKKGQTPQDPKVSLCTLDEVRPETVVSLWQKVYEYQQNPSVTPMPVDAIVKNLATACDKSEAEIQKLLGEVTVSFNPEITTEQWQQWAQPKHSVSYPGLKGVVGGPPARGAGLV